jgi:hypothetical protein
MFYSITMVLLYSLFLLFYYFTVLMPYIYMFYQTEGIQCFIRQRVFSVLSDREYSVFYQTESIQCFIRQRVFSVLSDREYSVFYQTGYSVFYQTESI